MSARDQEAAERAKRIALIEAATRTERESQHLVSIAAAEKEAMEQRALADIAEANAAAVRYEKEAEGQTRLNEAENMRSDAARRSAIYENLVKNLPNIIRETVKPMENIEFDQDSSGRRGPRHQQPVRDDQEAASRTAAVAMAAT